MMHRWIRSRALANHALANHALANHKSEIHGSRGVNVVMRFRPVFQLRCVRSLVSAAALALSR
jgi:hypothetical protein